MNIFKKLFSFFKKDNTDDRRKDLNHSDRILVNFADPQERSRYFMDCLDQMEECSREVELLADEYSLVTDYLTDMEEIDALPEPRKKEIIGYAQALSGYDSEIRKFSERKSKMSDIDYYTLKDREHEVEEGIKKIRESEKYAAAVKRDLRRLDGERQARIFRKNEGETSLSNYKGMVVIFIAAYVFCMLLLVFFQFVVGLDVFIGYILATAGAAIACTVAAVRYMDTSKELSRIDSEINKLIQLQNTVKIRYVNNRKLLEFLYLKYHVESGEKLDKLWKAYQHEKEERRRFTEAQAQTEQCGRQLIAALSSLRIKYPDRWLMQIPALLDNKEMVELRHELIIRRQRVREQMDYNKKLAEEAKSEIQDIAKIYPEYAKEIIELLDNKE